MFKKFRQRQRILARIKRQLPKYAPDSGVTICWDIELGYYKSSRYDENTGKRIEEGFVPKPRISQGACNRIGSPVYYFDWNKKKLKTRKGCKWGR